MKNKVKLTCRVKHVRVERGKIITFDPSALKDLCEMLDVPYNPDIVAFTKRGVILK